MTLKCNKAAQTKFMLQFGNLFVKILNSSGLPRAIQLLVFNRLHSKSREM